LSTMCLLHLMRTDDLPRRGGGLIGTARIEANARQRVLIPTTRPRQWREGAPQSFDGG